MYSKLFYSAAGVDFGHALWSLFGQTVLHILHRVVFKSINQIDTFATTRNPVHFLQSKKLALPPSLSPNHHSIDGKTEDEGRRPRLVRLYLINVMCGVQWTHQHQPWELCRECVPFPAHLSRIPQTNSSSWKPLEKKCYCLGNVHFCGAG